MGGEIFGEVSEGLRSKHPIVDSQIGEGVDLEGGEGYIFRGVVDQGV